LTSCGPLGGGGGPLGGQFGAAPAPEVGGGALGGRPIRAPVGGGAGPAAVSQMRFRLQVSPAWHGGLHCGTHCPPAQAKPGEQIGLQSAVTTAAGAGAAASAGAG
jgi:hypothetical protein